MANTIRRLCVGLDPKNQFIYSIDGEFSVKIKDKQQRISISNIEESEKHFLVYVKVNDEVQLWKKLPKNDNTTIEFELD